MISLQVKVAEIDYDKTAEFLLPVVLEKWRDDSLPCRFFQMLGSATLSVLTGIMAGLSSKEKSELLYFLINKYDNELNHTVSKIIQDNSLEKIIKLGKIKMGIQESLIVLSVKEIYINYKNLTHNETVKSQIMKMVDKLPADFPGSTGIKQLILETIILIVDVLSTLAPNQVEMRMISLIQKDDSRKALVEILMQSLKEKGVYIDIADILVEQVSEPEAISHEKTAYRGNCIFPEYLEKAICDSVALYLKSVVLKEERTS